MKLRKKFVSALFAIGLIVGGAGAVSAATGSGLPETKDAGDRGKPKPPVCYQPPCPIAH
jgi:hypothetical protein